MNLSSRRQLLLDTAFYLFNRYGYHATGIDRIIKESGTSKATLYKNFKTKEILILEVLRERHKSNTKILQDIINNSDYKNEPVLSLFDHYTDWFKCDTFYGCFFHKAAAEFSCHESPINMFSFKVKHDLRDLVLSSLRNHHRDDALADIAATNIMLLLDGAIVEAHVSRNTDAAIHAKTVAENMLERL